MVYLQPIYIKMNDNYNKKLIEVQHLCIKMRGVEKQHSLTNTSAFSGIFLKDEKTYSKFMNLIQ